MDGHEFNKTKNAHFAKLWFLCNKEQRLYERAKRRYLKEIKINSIEFPTLKEVVSNLKDR